ncbi:MAG: PhzF family phenazine biosynthesis protein [candidate division WOR-3 bacterium]
MAKWVKAKRLSVFTSNPYAGNPAWVVMGADDIKDEDLKLLANDLNPVSDTAFVLSEQTHEADIYLRFFTGSGEINFSGHASIAAYFALSGENILNLKEPETTVRQRTKAGIQIVDLRVKDNKITRATMTLAKPNYLDIEVNPVQLSRILGISQHDLLAANLPFDIISTGYYDLIVPIKSLEIMKNIKPDFTFMNNFCIRLGIHGIIVFCMETFEPGDTVFMRHFAPVVGINEDPISGAAAGSVGCYLIRKNLIEPSNFSRIIVEQGYLQNRQGKVYVHVECSRDQIYRVKVGGNAVLTFTGYILAP